MQSVYVSTDGAAYVGVSTFTDHERRTTTRSWACEAITVRDGRIADIRTLLTSTVSAGRVALPTLPTSRPRGVV